MDLYIYISSLTVFSGKKYFKLINNFNKELFKELKMQASAYFRKTLYIGFNR